MRLTQLHVTNYQALRDVTIPLSRFGCLIGENNAGKSSFLQALSLFFSGTRSSGTYRRNVAVALCCRYRLISTRCLRTRCLRTY